MKPRATPKAPAKLARSPGTTEGATPLADFLGLDEVQMKVIDLKIGIAQAIIRLRGEASLTQAALAKRLGVSRPRIAEIEALKPSVSLDSLLPAFWGVGGTTTELVGIVRRTDDSMKS